jgi:predicted Zn finger-like uncharacterized protein
MEVICPKCNTTYDFEDTLIGPRGTVVRCTQCGHMFKLFRGGTEKDIDVAGWMIRKKEGPVFNVDRFSTLQKWIIEGKVTAVDELSRTGKSWKKLGEIVELSGLFKLSTLEGRAAGAVQADAPTATFSKADTMMAAGRHEPRASVKPQMEPGWEEMDTDRSTVPRQEPSPEFQKGEEGTVKGPLARSLDVEAAVKESEEGESIMRPVYQPARWKKLAILLVVLVLLVPIVYLVVAYRHRIFQWTGMITEPKDKDLARAKQLARAQDLITGDTPSGLDEAEKILKGITEKESQNLSAWTSLSEIYAHRAQLVKDEVDYPQLAGTVAGGEPGLQANIMPLVIKAREYAREAAKLAPASFETQRILADAMRLSGEYEGALKAINKALDAKPNDAKSIYVQVLLDFDQDKDVENAIVGLKRVLRKDENLLAAHYRLALLLAVSSKADDARKELSFILDDQEGHDPARNLLAAIDKGQLTAVAGTTPDAASDAPEDVPREPDAAGTAVVKAGGPELAKGMEPLPAGKSADYYVAQGNKLAAVENCAKAIEYFNKALSLSPSSLDAMDGKAGCYRDMGQLGNAVNEYRKALNQNSRFGPALIGLAEIFKQQGKLKLSLEQYKKYLDVLPSGPMAPQAKRNVEEIEDMLKAQGQPVEGGGETEGTQPDTNAPEVIKTTEEEVKSSIGQPTEDKPKTSGDPYD